MRRLLIAVAFVASMSSATAFAQNIPNASSRSVVLPAGTSMFKHVRLADGSPRRMVQPSAAVPQASSERTWPGRHPVLFGTLLGLGAGRAVEAAVIPGARGGEPHSVYVPMFGSAGAGIGALVGVIVSAAR